MENLEGLGGTLSGLAGALIGLAGALIGLPGNFSNAVFISKDETESTARKWCNIM